MQCGKVTDVRLIKTNKAGKGNVYAYVEFASTKGVEKALRLDRSMLTGRPMFVSPFKEKRSGDYGSTIQKVSESGEVQKGCGVGRGKRSMKRWRGKRWEKTRRDDM